MDTSSPFLTEEELNELLSAPRRICVLGIRPDSEPDRPAQYIPRFLASLGHIILPVPVREPFPDLILGCPTLTSLEAVDPPIDILSVFLRPERVESFLPGMLSAKPAVVWFQSGYLPAGVPEVLTAHGISVAYDCILCRAALRQTGSTNPYAVPSTFQPSHRR